MVIFEKNGFIRVIIPAFCLLFAMAIPCQSQDNAQNDKAHAQQSMHAKPWAFGYSEDRNSAIWHKGVNGDVISRKQKEEKNNNGMDNSQQIRDNEGHAKSSVGLSFKDETGSWKVAPSQKAMRPDEDKVRDSRHVVRAFADVEASDDLSFSIGPELILKDERRGDESAKSDQPDSELGMGMRFKYDF